MGFAFERPVGAASDVQELEFVSALLQTSQKLRLDGSIQVQDIVMYLSSRYGVQVSDDEVAAVLLQDFSPASSMKVGEDSAEKAVDDVDAVGMDGKLPSVLPVVPTSGTQFLDVMEFATLLLIPYLRRERTTDAPEADDERIATVLRMMLDDAGVVAKRQRSNQGDDDEADDKPSGKTGGGGDDKPTSSLPSSVELTVPVLQRLFASVGEGALARDKDLLQEMIDVVADSSDTTSEGGAVILDEESFAKALVHDLQKWNPETATDRNFKTTFDDAVGSGILMMKMDDKMTMENMMNMQMMTMTVMFPNDEKMAGTEASDEESNRANDTKQTMMANDKGERFIVLRPTASALDLAADPFRSRTLVVFSWLFYGMSFLSYYSGIGTFFELPACQELHFRASWAENGGAFLCAIGWSIFRWAYIVVIMGLYGLAYFSLTCVGNGVETKSPLTPFVGAVAAIGFTVYPLYIPAFTRADKIVDLILKVVTSTFGGIVAFLNLWYTVTLSIPVGSAFYMRYQSLFTSGAIKEEALQKQAGLKKTDAMVANALDLHTKNDGNANIDSYLGRALVNFAFFGTAKTERVGGLFWTWSRIWNRELFKTEGFWFSGRLVSINVAQFLISLLVLVGGLIITVLVTKSYNPPMDPIEQFFNGLFDRSPRLQNAAEVVGRVSTNAANFLTTGIPPNLLNCSEPVDPSFWANCTVDNLAGCSDRGQNWLCTLIGYTNATGNVSVWQVQAALLDRAGFSMDAINATALAALTQQSIDTVESLYPSEKYMIFLPLIFGTIAAFATSLTIALTVVPSMTTTVLKLRSGAMEFMRDPKQSALRYAPEQIASLRGAMFWGTLLSSGLMGIVFGVIVFLIVYQNTSTLAMYAFAMFIGVVVVILIQYFLIRSFRSQTSRAFYRKRVLFSNVVLLMRECGFFALTVGYTLFRVIKLIGTTILFVGRLDIPFLSPGVGEVEAFDFKLDNDPYVFLMDLLSHEAHRHPYIQIFGAVCLLKLRYGPRFVTRAGSAWRLLLVAMLMPWLARYRRLSRAPTPGEDSKDGPGASVEMPVAIGDDMMGETVEDLRRQVRTMKEQMYIMQMMKMDDPMMNSKFRTQTIEI